ncbi:phosphotransferase enzyme family protein [Micromonospora purpureochromogenes]|uniref:Spectinomycin phosphotransferase n=1 Tax=Micromonospora purpureochromogenes TaxID=47872 RepID=A0ABX2RIB6_9ACTN|nr:aminoglycoside phosphotransferase family protein [Micromonospora purpureochromogenes]NYF55885.1 spectinomycin phosphotransferase [Micromonospora purpureochromogenes]
MRDRPVGLTEAELIAALTGGWGIEVDSAGYLPVGAGSYHWSMVDRRGTAWFVKVADLGFDGAGRDETFDRLGRSYDSALALRREAGLDFVLAPVPSGTGATLWRLTPRYAVSVFPMVAGAAGRFGAHRPEDRADLVDLLAELHRATPVVAGLAPRADLVLPGRDQLREALCNLDREWTGGPYGEPTRKLLSAHVGYVEGLLAEFDRRVERVRASVADWVVTHGEPHPGNVMWTPDGLRLIDWDTVRIAPAERDLWMLTGALARMVGEDPVGDDEEILARYARATGRTVTPAVLDLYPLWWKLADIAVYVDALRRPHGTGEDITASLTYLTGYLESSPD